MIAFGGGVGLWGEGSCCTRAGFEEIRGRGRL